MKKPFVYRAVFYGSNWWMVHYPRAGKYINIPVYYTKPFSSWESAIKFALDPRAW